MLACGCLPYVMPALDVTPPLTPGGQGADVRAFRFDVSERHGSPCYGSEQYSLCEIPRVAGIVPPQAQPGIDSGLIIIGPLSYHFHHHEGVQVRLYRPGYQTITAKSWDVGKRVIWEPAETVAAREHAIDDVIAPSGDVTSSMFLRQRKDGEWRLPPGLRPGSFSPAHRRCLEFVVREYRELAESPLATKDDRTRLLDRAAKIQNLTEPADAKDLAH